MKCTHCKTEFSAKKKTRKFCSHACCSKFYKGKKKSKAHREKISKALKGHEVSEETRQKIRDTRERDNIEPWNKGKKTSQKVWNKGKKGIYSDEYRKKIGKATRKRWKDPEFRKKVVEGQKRNAKYKDTKPELILQKELKSRKVSYIKHNHKVYGIPDIFIEPNICVFVDGCYWHGCKKCGKSEKKRKRDKQVNKKLNDKGYIVYRFWEHEIEENAKICVDNLLATCFSDHITVLTGSGGFIGSRFLKAYPNDAIYLVDRKDGLDVNYTQFRNKVKTVVHLSAQAGAIPSWDDPYQDAMDNIMATIKICRTFPGAKLIFTTSGAALDPESPYGLSKRTAEEYIKMIHPNSVILRLSSVYGEKDRGVVDNFIRDDKCIVYGDGSAVRDFVHVDDIVRGLIQAKDWDPITYTMGSGKGTRVQDLAEATGKEIRYCPARIGEKQEVVLQNTTPDWSPEIDVIQYIKEKCKK